MSAVLCRSNIELRDVVIFVDQSCDLGSSADRSQARPRPGPNAFRCPGAAAAGTGAACTSLYDDADIHEETFTF
jgi:hypothetical protein